MAGIDSKDTIAVNGDTIEKVVDPKTDLDQNNPSAGEKTVAEEPPKSTRLWIERLVLCVALFFPLFLATLDTSIPPILISY